MSDEKWKTAEELMTELNKNPEFLRRRASRDKRRREREEQFAQLDAPVVEKMRALGFDAISIIDAINKYSPIPDQLVELFLESVRHSSDVKLLEWLIRALAAARRPFNGQALIECYGRFNDIELRWVILNTIACARPHSIEDWIQNAILDPYVSDTLEKLGYKK